MKGERKSSVIPVRVTESQKQLLEKQAATQGLGVSAWLRMLGLQAAASNSQAATGAT